MRKLWIQFIATGVVLAIVVTVACITAGSREIDRAQLKIQAGELRSYASSAALLVEQARQQKLTRAFWSTQLDQLRESAQSAADTLHRAQPTQGLEGRVDQSRRIADELVGAVHALAGAGTDAPHLQRIESDLNTLTSEAEALRTSLQEPRK